MTFASPPGKTAGDFSHLSVLLVDDEAFAVRLEGAVLKQLGITDVRVARDGAEAVRMLEEAGGNIDLVISDWNMPNMSGLELLRRVRQEQAGIPFIMLTSKVTEQAVREAVQAGVDGYLAKPFSPSQLRTRIQAILSRR